MKDKILSLLKTKYANLGFTSKELEAVATQLAVFVTEEDKIATAVEGAESMLKSFQSFADSRVGNYKTKVEEVEAKLVELEKGKGKDPEDPKPDDANAKLLEIITELKEKVEGFEKKSNTETKLSGAKELMGKSKLPKNLQSKWLNRLNLEEDLDEQIKGLESEYEETYGNIQKGTGRRGLPSGGRTDLEVSDEVADKIVDEL